MLVHCYHGADRTGLLCAAYRVLIEEWSIEEAVKEMVLGGFGYHKVYRSYVTILQNLDVEAMRERMKRFAAAHFPTETNRS